MLLAQHGMLGIGNPSGLQELRIGGRTNLITYGDSITVGQNASIPANSYAELLEAEFFSTRTDSALSGRGIWRAAATAIGATYTRTNTVVTFMAGLNDIRRNGSAAATLNKIEAGARVIFCKGIHASAFASGHSTVTRTGAFTAYNAAANGGLYGTGAIPGNVATYNYTNGDKWSWTFTGTEFGINFIVAAAGEGWGTFDVKVDGVIVQSLNGSGWYDGISDGVYDNKRGPLSLTWHGFTNTSHTVEVVNTGSGTDITLVDFFFELLPPASANAVIGLEIPYLNSTGYAIAPASGSVAASILASERIFQVMDFYRSLGYPNVYIPVNDFYDLSTGLDTDNIHPNDTGHLQIFNAINQYVHP